MKKWLLIVLLPMLLLTGCAKKVNCAECGQTKKGKTYTIEVLGQTRKADICDDCIDQVRSYVTLVGGKIK